MIQRQVETKLPTKWGDFQMIAYSAGETYQPHIAMVKAGYDVSQPVLVRLHSECLTGDLFGSLRCDCGEQLEAALRMTSEAGGVILYLRQEGRGIGILNKMKAYNLQDEGLNTREANIHLGFEPDLRTYECAVFMLNDLGITKIRLLTNNPAKIEAFAGSNIEVVERVPLLITPQKENLDYLLTKENEMGHLLDLKKEEKKTP